MKFIFRHLLLAAIIGALFPQPAQAQVANNNPTGPAGDYNSQVTTAGSYDPFTGSASREICDISVAGAVGAYPLKWTRRMNTRAIHSANTFGHGGGWSHSYQWGLEVNHPAAPTPTPPNWTDERPDAVLNYPDGRSVDLVDPWSDVDAIPAAAEGPYGRMDRFIDRHGGDYELLLADGGVVKFHKLNPGNPYCRVTAIVDPYNLETTLHYDGLGRLEFIKEPGGPNRRFLQIKYRSYQWPLPGGVTANIDLIDRVEANDGFNNVTQSVDYVYEPRTFTHPYIFLYLTRVNYNGGDRSVYEYQQSNRLPINVTDLDGSFVGLIERCDDDRFDGPMKVIRYKFGPPNSGNAYGELWKEKNAADRVISELIIPSGTPPYPGLWRKERRADNSERDFIYGNGAWLTDRSDFEGHWTHSTIVGDPNNPNEANECHFTDERGYTTKKRREGDFQATTKVTYPDVTYPEAQHAFVEMEYDHPLRRHYVKYRWDEKRNKTEFVRNADHSVQSIHYPSGSVAGRDYPEFPDSPSEPWEFFTYSGNGFRQIETHTIPNGGIENLRYDDRGLKERSWPPPTSSDLHPQDHPTKYFYYTAGTCGGRWYLIDRLWYVEDPRGNQTSYDYNERGQVTIVTHHEDNSFTESHYNHDGSLQWVEDELRHRTTFEYDDYKRVTHVKKTVGADNSVEDTVTYYAPPDTGIDPYWHTTLSIYRGESPQHKKVDYDYDRNFRRTKVILAPDEPGDKATTLYHYDPAGNMDWVQDPRTYVTSYGYDERNRQTTVTRNTPPETTITTYDPASNKIKEQRPDGALRSWDYDAMNRLHHAYDWRINDPPRLDQTTTYDRDSGGVVRYISDTKGAIYRFDYDLLNRKTTATYPEDASNLHRSETWHYDFAGNMDLYTNPAGQVKHLQYDHRNRMDYSYWTGNGVLGPAIRTKFDVANRIEWISTNDGVTKIDFGYDEANRQIWEEQRLALPNETPISHRVNTPVDHDGLRQSLGLTDPPAKGGHLSVSSEMEGSGSLSVSYQYTKRNQLKNINGGSGENWAFTYKYDLNGNMLWRKADYNESHTNWTQCPGPDLSAYDELNRPKAWEQTGPNGFHALSHHQYDRANREEATWRDEDQGLGERFTYEPTNQLATVAYKAQQVWNPNPLFAARTVSYGYAAGNLNRSIVTEILAGQTPTTTNYTPDPLNQYTVVGGSSYSYDNNFNLTQAGMFSGVYNAANQLVSASNSGGFTAGFVYDGLGRCVKRTLGGDVSVFVYDGWKPIGEFDQWGNFQAWNVYGAGADEILLRQKDGMGYTLFLLDRHGNVAFLLDNDGDLREKYTYDVFGQPTVTNVQATATISATWYDHDFLFQGREYISQLGIYDYRNRFYFPATGRFLQTDPTGFDAGDINLFRYCGDDPMDGSDPLGLSDLNYVPTWDYDNHRLVNSGWDGREYNRRMYKETKDKMVVVSAHGAKEGYVMNSIMTKTAFTNYNNKPSIPVPKSMRLDIKELVDAIKKLDNYTAAKPIRLDICYAGLGGNNSVGQQVANGLSSNQVTANTDKVRPDSGKGAGEWRDFNSPESKRPTNVVNKSVRSYQDNNSSPSLGGAGDPSNAPSARDVDLRHQSTGVPSLGAEAVNFAPGRP